MIDLQKQLKEIQTLFCDPTLPNSSIIRSHCMEIMISFSETPEFVEVMRSNEEILKTLIIESNNQSLNYKALILLVNLSSDEQICNSLQTFGVVSNLYKIILLAMKKIDESHLQITSSLLKLAEESEGSSSKVDDHSIQLYTLSQDKVDISAKQLILDLDAIKLSIMIMINLSALSSASRKDILQKGSIYEGNNILLILDWMLNHKTYLIFAQFTNVLLSLSSDEELLVPFVENCQAKLCQILEKREEQNDFEKVQEIGHIFRNLGFYTENEFFVKCIIKEKFIQNSVDYMKRNITNPKIIDFSRSIIDLLLAVLTTDNASKNPESFRFFYEYKPLAEILPFLTENENSDKYYADRISALEHMLSNWS